MPPLQHDDSALFALLRAVGAHLFAAEESASIVVVGGATLCLRGWVPRTTRDVDVIALTAKDKTQWSPPDLPKALVKAAAQVARDFNTDPDWLNSVIGAQWLTGLPDGIGDDMQWLTFDSLEVGLIGRQAMIALKLIAAVDQGRSSVHFQDLVALAPTDFELQKAKPWVTHQDTAPDFPALVEDVISHVHDAL